MREFERIENKMYQVSTLQALAMGYTRPVIKVSELLTHGDTGLGTFTDIDGEMILVDGKCWRADVNGSVQQVSEELGVPFAAVAFQERERVVTLPNGLDIDGLKTTLNNRIEEKFGLNSMHMVRVDGYFEEVRARSEVPYHSQHVTLKEILSKTQKDFTFRELSGTLVCVYFPDYLDTINASGWHVHFISKDRSLGGHVFQFKMVHGEALIDKIQNLEVQIPTEPAFDTYSLKNASNDEIRQVEQGK